MLSLLIFFVSINLFLQRPLTSWAKEMSVSDLEICNWSYEGDVKTIQAAVESDGTLVSKTDSSLRTGLHWACSSGKMEVVNLFMAKGAKVKLSHLLRLASRDFTFAISGQC